MPTATPRSYFDEALRLLAREGRNGLRIGRLCAALGVTSGSFYHHFGSWEGFVAALLEHWEREEVGRIVELVNASDDPVERVTRMKYLALTVPHEAETAIRAWATVDPVVDAAQRAVDRGRLRALADVLAPVIDDAERRERLAALGVAVLAGHQQIAGVASVDLSSLLDEFDLLVRAHSSGIWDPTVPDDAPWHEQPAREDR
ncbi:TetR/AcrR family transcriptional regulator [Actinomycetospora cinnamomea]|uniref:TetR family transcriptional regulator n=1 Tax=Actinomycetospora cinnamomea TaxID=663609 RepID=A0A2U1FE12_9PSEU|nr:TetR/AcrR family transcriptional regulator [Actinomycetospora cinnamomea]PVZ10200.1 TetR family transcriptional regulator [Actinomycetospora cinnamomea]